MSPRALLASLCLMLELASSPVCAQSILQSNLLIADKTKESTGAENSKEPSTDSGSGGKPFTSGSDFKTGPVTDDEKLIRPVTTDTKVDKKGDAKVDGKDKPSNASDAVPQIDERNKTTEKAAEDTADNPNIKKNVDVKIDDKGPISAGALRVAQQMELTPILDQMIELKKTRVYVPGKLSATIEVLAVRQDLDESILSAFLQTRRVISELDRQIQGYDAVARVLEDKRDQAIRNNNILNFTSGGALAIIGGSVQIGTPTKFQNAGDELAIVAGGLSALISAYALKLQKGGKRDAEADPNMLAPVFGLVPNTPNKYTPLLWEYLNDYEPGQKLSRRQQLIDKWVKLEYIDALDKKSSPQQLKQYAGVVALHKEVSIDMLRNRIPMLEDLKATVAGMNEYLDEILTFIRKR